MPTKDYSNRRKIILALTIISGVILLYTLRDLFPAFLGAVVLYVLFRPFYSNLRHVQKWPNWLATWTIMLSTFLLIVLPMLTVILMIGNKLSNLLINTDQITAIIDQVQVFFGMNINDDMAIEQLISFIQNNLFGGVSTLLNGVLGTFFTLAMMYFMLYYMLVQRKNMQAEVNNYLPFNHANIKLLSGELESQTLSNSIGVPLIATIQGTAAGIGYWIFGMEEPIFWAVITAFASIIPIAGSTLVWAPAAIILMATNSLWMGLGLIAYGAIVIINIDNIARFTIQKKFADVHPLITVFGVILGLNLFGIPGLIFGPLMLSYFIIFIKMYRSVYVNNESNTIHENNY